MLTADQHGLPRALAERLGDEARAAFAEAPREARFRLLAQALNLDEAALLAELARLTGLEVLAEPAIDAEGPDWWRRLSPNGGAAIDPNAAKKKNAKKAND